MNVTSEEDTSSSYPEDSWHEEVVRAYSRVHDKSSTNVMIF